PATLPLPGPRNRRPPGPHRPDPGLAPPPPPSPPPRPITTLAPRPGRPPLLIALRPISPGPAVFTGGRPPDPRMRRCPRGLASPSQTGLHREFGESLGLGYLAPPAFSRGEPMPSRGRP